YNVCIQVLDIIFIDAFRICKRAIAVLGMWQCVSVALLQAVRCLGIILGCWECDSEAYRRYRFRLL
ncbi:MAG: hypothetical protein ACK5P3_20160, partial [Dolichospermum sp.]